MSKLRSVKLLLDEYSIEELRILGRNLGIKSPTGLSKDKLAEEIVLAIKGCENEKKETRGRPPKYALNLIDNIENNFIENVKEEEKPDIKVDKIYTYEVMDVSKYGTMRLSSPVEEYRIVEDKNDKKYYVKNTQNEFNIENYVDEIADAGLISCTGVVELVDGEYVLNLLDFDGRLLLSGEMVRLYNIRPFDTVKALVMKNQTGKYSVIIEILTVNNEELKIGQKRSSFKDLTTIPPTGTFKKREDKSFLQVIERIAPICKGARVLVENESEESNFTYTKEIVESFNSIGVETFSIFIDNQNETKKLAFDLGSNSVFVGFGETPEEKCRKILTQLYRAQNFVECGQDSVVIINNFDGLYDCLTSLITDENPNYMSNIALKFFNQGGKYDNGGSLTMFGFVSGKNLRLTERLKSSASIFVPVKNDDVDIINIQNKYEKFYMDKDAISVVEDIKKVVESKGKDKYLSCLDTITNMQGVPGETILSALYKL